MQKNEGIKDIILTIIIPMYQAERYIDQCLESIEREMIDEIVGIIEVLVIDDGSTDNTLSRALIWEKKCRWVRVFRHTNHGVGYTRNRGIRNAKGQYIWFVDVDDNIVPASIRSITQILRENDLPIYFFGYRTHLEREQLNEFDTFCDYEGIFRKEQKFKSIFWNLYSKNLIHNVGTKIYNRRILVENKIRFKENLSIYEDAIFCLEVIKYSSEIWISKDIYYCYNLERNISSLNHQYRENFEKAIYILFGIINSMINEKDLNYYINLAKSMDGALNNELRQRGETFKKFKKFCLELLENSEMIAELKKNDKAINNNMNCKLLLRRKFFTCYINLKKTYIKNMILISGAYNRIFDALYKLYKQIGNR